MGRPTKYTPEMAKQICELRADGKSLRQVCREVEIHISSIYEWRSKHPEFSEQYAQASIQGWESIAEDLLDISDNSTNDWMESNNPDNPGYKYNGDAAARSRLRVDTRKWLLSKMVPKMYGDKVTQDITTDGTIHVKSTVRSVSSKSGEEDDDDRS